ncbi:MAG: phage holin family protein [Candidatus Pacebacteria bacterium]|nr:phage holin family protein [Candidatus Paceibacterota bacterium]MCD8508165.1 phage holin family protein [Candidatus Paceibacterota bacterium]MCD8528068.1 phage holin family protein [Candidatus Paceibacterota bacterium]MCD8563399.1 phage holin family protein [Candidatus Paceibacterota bacterium]
MILRALIKWVLLSIIILLLPYFIPGIAAATTGAGLLAGFVIGLINVLIKPFLKIVTLPLNILTFGVFGFLLNAVLFWVASLVVPGFEITTYAGGILGSLVVAVGLWIINQIL